MTDEFDFPAYPKAVDLAPRLKARRPFTAGKTRLILSGSTPPYPALERWQGHSKFEPDDLDRYTAELLAEHPDAYAIYSFQNPLAWWDDRRWNISTVRAGKTGIIQRTTIMSALDRLGLGWHTVRLPHDE